jgi:hypothetical protein
MNDEDQRTKNNFRKKYIIFVTFLDVITSIVCKAFQEAV